MKRLYLIRHAKSSWKEQVSDHERPLKKRGFSDAALVSKHTKDLFTVPDLILSSTAKRAKSTAVIFLEHWEISQRKLILSSDLYDFSGEHLLRTVQNCNNSNNSLMIFAHNFAITDFVNIFGNQMINNVPTSGFVLIEFDTKRWNMITKGETVFTMFPSDLKQ
jgi:phosphohistidine phosphatase